MKPNTVRIEMEDENGNITGTASFATDLQWLDLLPRVSLLASPVTGSPKPRLPNRAENKGTGKYAPLTRFLAEQTENGLTLSFREVETVLGFELPPTARGTHARSWWANTTTHVQGRAWLDEGWKTGTIDPENETLEFRRG